MSTQGINERLVTVHSVSDQSFADDTQLFHSYAPNQIQKTVLTLHTYISDVKNWMTLN